MSRPTYLGDDESLDKHNHRACDDRGQSDDVENAENIQDDVAWSGQVLR